MMDGALSPPMDGCCPRVQLLSMSSSSVSAVAAIPPPPPPPPLAADSSVSSHQPHTDPGSAHRDNQPHLPPAPPSLVSAPAPQPQAPALAAPALAVAPGAPAVVVARGSAVSAAAAALAARIAAAAATGAHPPRAPAPALAPSQLRGTHEAPPSFPATTRASAPEEASRLHPAPAPRSGAGAGGLSFTGLVTGMKALFERRVRMPLNCPLPRSYDSSPSLSSAGAPCP